MFLCFKKQLVQDSWNKVLAGRSTKMQQLLQDQHASYTPFLIFYDAFYNHLFTISPAIQQQFFSQGGVQQRATSLVRMVNMGIDVWKEDKIRERLTKSAKSHAQHLKVDPEHYEPTVKALLHALHYCLDVELTQEIEQAWKDIYEYGSCSQRDNQIIAIIIITFS